MFNTTWSTPWDGLDLNARWRYYAHLETRSSRAAIRCSTATASRRTRALEHVPAYSYFDLTATFNVYKSVRLGMLGVNNVTDKVPPLIVGADCSTSSPGVGGANCNGNTFPGVYDAMGRNLFAHITAQF